MGGVLRYTNGRHIAIQMGGVLTDFPFPQSVGAMKALQYKLEAYCNTNWRCIANTFWRSSGGWGFWHSSEKIWKMSRWGTASKNKSKTPWASILTLSPCGNRCRFSERAIWFSQVSPPSKIKSSKTFKHWGGIWLRWRLRLSDELVRISPWTRLSADKKAFSTLTSTENAQNPH